jgi:Holliday junction resolvase RusA-like endonuclease
MHPKDLIRHRRFDTPSYLIWVRQRPTHTGKGKQVYKEKLKAAAKLEIAAPIATKDVEVEVLYSGRFSKGSRKDVDNILKPTLDGLNGVAYVDDRQGRSVTATLFVKDEHMQIQGYAQYLAPLIYSDSDHAVLVAIYSDSRLKDLGGEKKVREERERRELQEIDDRTRSAQQRQK